MLRMVEVLEMHDCKEAGGRAPKVGALGDAGSGCRGAFSSKTASMGYPAHRV